jgi:hypothetical protein
VYSSQPFQGNSLQFLVSSVPEPSSLTLALVAIPALAGWAYRRRSRAS